ncbi:LysR family transcriptional regulator [Vibrio cincinnatiensis]|jgi:DNA-binding transcriptional LysR family regulator|uniref:LysR family transcriptional regulator n=1 Tax=Vibrio cincinnatiensis TaxID=675 RepID=UPI001EDE2FD0|nr:LysR family transcriptional regulator [Vibrio cincinnatiensis]MCG3732374.1 LysR family transcriptional regulator [Vibrio cincinnatiensis]MCG3735579.1 LysR family transcriptional regulator [Vibrio cincinnatiensis]MCG3738993.1 LysR family transcriptional regulator [Vibrio cincinnatiensis]MCG3741950.1 LysR family transcriptional regulator [Vibrio cincinnatiensis]MCG3745547.1 LysR family transcriptional regulator [Vibrio cincinnatiensis]
MDKLTAMRSFVEVANVGSFTQAAENLNLSRLQISRHVQEIEGWLKQRLLHRTTRKVSLTAAGEEALKQCEQILHQTAELEMRALEQAQSLSGRIRLSAPIGLAHHLLLDAIESFTEKYPQVTIDVLASDRLAQLVDERVDIALRFTQQPDDHLIARRLFQVDTVICASPHYLTQHPPLHEPNDLRNHNCFIHLSNHKWEFIRDNRSYSVNVNGTLRANDMSLLCRAAVHGKGIVLLPCDLANHYLQTKQLIRLLPDYHIPSSALWAVYLSRSYQSPLVRQFIDFVSEQWSSLAMTLSTESNSSH